MATPRAVECPRQLQTTQRQRIQLVPRGVTLTTCVTDSADSVGVGRHKVFSSISFACTRIITGF